MHPFISLVLFLTSFLSIHLLSSRILKHSLFNPINISISYVIFWGYNILVGYTVSFTPEKYQVLTTVSLLILPLLLATISCIRYKPARLSTTLGITGILLSGLFTVGLYLIPIPVSDTDSISYVLPMVDGAHSYDTWGAWSSDNHRSLTRFWGLQAQIYNYTMLARSYEGVLIVTALSFLFFTSTLIATLRYIFKGKLPLPTLTLLALPLVLNPFFLVGVFTLKDDIAFAGFSLLTGLLILSKLNYKNLHWLLTIVIFGLTSAKVFYPIILIATFCFLVILFSKKYLTGKRFIKLLTALTIGTVCTYAINLPRIENYYQLVKSTSAAGFIKPTLKTYIAGFLGAAPYEVTTDTRTVPTKTSLASTKAQAEAQGNAIDTFGFNNATSLYNHIIKGLPSTHKLYYYNYTYLNILILLLFTGLGYLLYSLFTNTKYKPILIYITLVLLTFLFLYPNPSTNNVRYVYGVLAFFTALGTCAIFKSKSQIVLIPILLLSLTFTARLLFHPAVKDAWIYYMEHGQAPSPLQVNSFNPVLKGISTVDQPSHLPTLEQKTPVFIISAPAFPGFSAYPLLTYPNLNLVYEVPFDQKSISSVAGIGPMLAAFTRQERPLIILNGAWKSGIGNLNPDGVPNLVPKNYSLTTNIGPDQIFILK